MNILSSIPIKSSTDKLFKGLFIRWQLLTQSEKTVGCGIILIPLWWIFGWGLMLLAWTVAIVVYELFIHKCIRLSRPSIAVIALITFSVYTCVIYATNSPEVRPRELIDPLLTWGCGGVLLWYIQSHNIRVRLEVAAWAFSITICSMLGLWLFCHFILAEQHLNPSRTIFATLTEKGEVYRSNKLGSIGNYLVLYYGEKGLGGLARYTFFFPHPTVSSFAIGFVGLIALDLKQRYWSLILVAACTFLILICQARNAWIALSIVLSIRWLVLYGKKQGLALLLVLFAVGSFSVFSIPSMTNYITSTYGNTVQATSSFRKESTDTRNKIYQRTLESIVKEPTILGHGINGASVQPGYEFAKIGTESFVLGGLLYKSGMLGTSLFLTFFIAFLIWLYRTKTDRPACCFLMMLYFTLASLVTEFMLPEIFIMLLCGLLSDPIQKRQRDKVIKSL